MPLTTQASASLVSRCALPAQSAGDLPPNSWGKELAHTRDPTPTELDPNDPKSKQTYIPQSESFEEYMARRSGSQGATTTAAAPVQAASSSQAGRKIDYGRPGYDPKTRTLERNVVSRAVEAVSNFVNTPVAIPPPTARKIDYGRSWLRSQDPHAAAQRARPRRTLLLRRTLLPRLLRRARRLQRAARSTTAALATTRRTPRVLLRHSALRRTPARRLGAAVGPQDRLRSSWLRPKNRTLQRASRSYSAAPSYSAATVAASRRLQRAARSTTAALATTRRTARRLLRRLAAPSYSAPQSGRKIDYGRSWLRPEEPRRESTALAAPSYGAAPASSAMPWPSLRRRQRAARSTTARPGYDPKNRPACDARPC